MSIDKCPKCKGNGRVRAEIPLWAIPDVNNCNFTEKCTTCKGTGRRILKIGSVMFPVSEPCPNCTRD